MEPNLGRGLPGKDRVRDGEIFPGTKKKGKLVCLPIQTDLKAALDVRLEPRARPPLFRSEAAEDHGGPFIGMP